MDLQATSLRIRLAEAVSVSPAASSVQQPTSFHSGADTSFPILVIAVIGIVATIFLLVSYYIFVIKCCLNWHRIDILSRFSLSRGRRDNEQLLVHTQPDEPRGLDESIIRSIPIFRYKKRGERSRDFDERSYCECAVCLNEFQEEEKLRIIPNCSHVFHIDCIDIWLQNNANCPMCRTSVSARPTAASMLDLIEPARLVAPSPSPQDPIHGQPVIHSDEDYVVIELGSLSSSHLNYTNPQTGSGEPSNSPNITGPSPRKPGISGKDRKWPKGSSMGDEFINTRGSRLCYNDKSFEPVQPMRRSISMDSAADRQLLLAVREIMQQKRERKEIHSLSSMDFSRMDQRECSSSNSNSNSNRLRRTFFSFGQGRYSRNAIQPISLEP